MAMAASGRSIRARVGRGLLRRPRRLPARTEPDHGDDLLTPALARPGRHQAVVHAGVGLQRGLDLLGEHLLAAGVDRHRVAAVQLDRPVGTEAGPVAVRLDSKISFGTINRKIQKKVLAIQIDELLTLGRNLLPLHRRPKFVFQWAFVKQIVEGIAFKARTDQRIDKRSGVSQRLPISCLENVVSNAERRAILSGDSAIVARISDIYAAIPSITGKIELEYEGELKGADTIARDLIKQSILMAFRHAYPTADFKTVIEFFEMGGNIHFSESDSMKHVLVQLCRVPTLLDRAADSSESGRIAQGEFILEGLYASDKIGRSEERGFVGVERKSQAQELYRDYTLERSRSKKPLN